MYLKHNFTSEAKLKENLDFIYDQSSKGNNFHGIIEMAFHEVTITTAIHNIKSNKGSKTSGIDKVKMDKYLQMKRGKLINLIRNTVRNYKPKPARRQYIPKDNGKMRPLGIPTILDRIVQECLRIIIEPIAEAKFYPNSYGFRPYRASKHAMKDIMNIICVRANNKPVYAIEGDIRGYFDNINHRILMKKLWKIGIHDKRVLSIIKEMLKAGYIDNETFYDTDKGTIQGGIISPLLANIYLNDFDWHVGRMYHHPNKFCSTESCDRKRLRKMGVAPKYLVRYADDWIILTTTEKEASRLLNYLKGYFKYRLKLELSDEKTVITNLTETPAKFLGFIIKAGLKRKTPENPNPQNIVGKHYPNMSKIKAKVKLINKEIKKLIFLNDTKEQAVQIEKVNLMITGLTEYHKTAICSNAFNYIDDKVYKCAYSTFRKKFGKKYRDCYVTLDTLSNRPQRHKGYKSHTFAVRHNGMYIGITKAFLTHSQWEKYAFNHNTTPYTQLGRSLYLDQYKKKKKLPLDRPPLYDINTLELLNDNELNNFEYYMNREYAYNRDQGKCKICGARINSQSRHCHRVNESLPVNEINKVFNLIWLCRNCDSYIHGKDIPIGFENGKIKKIEKYRAKLN